jgi:hypothetical protein
MDVLTKYRLELHWDSVEYAEDDRAVFKGAYFTGPVLSDAAQINDDDELILDITKQHVILAAMEDFYQAVLKWKGVDYKDDKVFLKECWVKGKYVNSLEKLENDDWILIDCREHEEENHPFLLVYWAEIYKKEKERKF